MIRLAALLALVLIPSLANAQLVLKREYATATTIDFTIPEIDGIDFRVDAVCATGDIKVSKDEAAEGNTNSCFVDEGTGYSLALTVTELTASRVIIYLIDQTGPKAWLDKSIIIETYCADDSLCQHETSVTIKERRD